MKLPAGNGYGSLVAGNGVPSARGRSMGDRQQQWLLRRDPLDVIAVTTTFRVLP